MKEYLSLLIHPSAFIIYFVIIIMILIPPIRYIVIVGIIFIGGIFIIAMLIEEYDNWWHNKFDK